MHFDLNSLLYTIASLSASFVAILGGFIASKVISINNERAVCKSSLRKLKFRKFFLVGERDSLRKALNENNAICYIYAHMTELVLEMKLEEIYDEAELQVITLADLEPLWIKAQALIKSFDNHIDSSNCILNSDGIPKLLAEELTDDIFAYEICMMYSKFDTFEFTHSFNYISERKEWDKRTSIKIEDYSSEIVAIEIQENQYELDLQRLAKPKGMSGSFYLFTLFSVFNIIMPLVLSLFRFTERIETMIAFSSISMLAIGLLVTFILLTWILKEEKETEEENV